MNIYSSFLFAQPSFSEGFGRAFDIGGLMDQYNTSPSVEQADSTALRADWTAVGDALRNAVQSQAVVKIK